MVVKSDLDSYDEILYAIVEKTFNDENAMEIHDISIVTLYSSMVEKARSIQLLIDNKLFDSVEVIQRSMVEQNVSLKYILQKDTIRRGRAFFYGHRYKEIKDIEDTLSYHPDRELIESIKQGIKEKFEIESKKKYGTFDEYQASIVEKYDELFQKRIKNRKYWFNIDGQAKSIAKLFELMGEANEYYGLYVPNSAYTHGSGIVTDTNVKKGMFEIKKSINPRMINVVIMKNLKESIEAIGKYYGVEVKKDQRTAAKYQKIVINYKYNNMKEFDWPI